MTADDVRGEDYEAAKPVPARTRVTGDPWVRDHLPECAERRAEWRWSEDCICVALRACEQRSYALGIEVGKHDGWVAGHAAGVQAAREAVAAVADVGDDRYVMPYMQVEAALAAIDALRADHA